MKIVVRYFASIREQMGCSQRIMDIPDDEVTVQYLWGLHVRDGRVSEKWLAAINQEYAAYDCTIRDGDEVAFFPPVTGG